jgi:hypothetical protein
MLRALGPLREQYFARPAQGLPFGEREGRLCERARARITLPSAILSREPVKGHRRKFRLWSGLAGAGFSASEVVEAVFGEIP